MAEVVIPDDILEQILKTLDVKDLIRFKSVCKSWKSFISSPPFIKTHMNHSYITDRNDNRRIYLRDLRYGLMSIDDFDTRKSFIVGSSNGLVCICTQDDLIALANPYTREVKKLLPVHPDFGWLCLSNMCFGFGYDSSGDDYKVVFGFQKEEHEEKTCFHVLGLKSNVWKVIGEVNYRFITKVGTLCNGALHWVMYPKNQKKKKAVILSFDLSHEDFKEIPQPDDDALYQSLDVSSPNTLIAWDRLPDMCLGVSEECLCILSPFTCPFYIWKMNIYNLKQSWEVVEPDRKRKYELLHNHRQLDKDMPFDMFLSDFLIELYRDPSLIVNPVFVPSLVSPHALFTDGQEEYISIGWLAGCLEL